MQKNKSTENQEIIKLKKLLNQKEKEIDVLKKITEIITSEMDIEQALQLIVTLTAGMMGSKICSIMLINEDGKELAIKATQSLSEEYCRKPPIKIGYSISGQVVTESKPIAVLDVTKAKGYTYPDIAKRAGIISMLCVPMMIKNKIIGVINSYTSKRHIFTKLETEILQAVANQSAVVIENARLMEEKKAAQKALETRKLVERAKGILMKETGISEEDAYHLIQKKSMATGRPMKDIAEAIITVWEIRSNK